MTDQSLLHEWQAWLPDLLPGWWLSIRLAAISFVTGTLIGLGLAVLSSSPRRTVRTSVILIVEIGRGTPALVLLQLVYFGLPSTGITVGSFSAAYIALSLCTAAYTSEILRAGLQAVPEGEIEAASALGMSRRDCMRFIVIPQGFRIAIPPLTGFAVLIFQATALAFTVSLPELLSRAYSLGTQTFLYFDALMLAGLLYLVVTIPGSWLTSMAERRLSKHI
jgi:polar amino acid transport system permease protein